MAKLVATIEPREVCCPSVLASPLDSTQAADLARGFYRAGRSCPATGVEHPQCRAGR